MTLDQQLNYCRVCENRKMNPAIGLVCGLTNAKPAFDPTCPHIRVDQKEADRLIALEKAAVQEEEAIGAFTSEKRVFGKGVWGGIAMIAVAVIWFFAGLAAGYIYFYPPILLIAGIVALVKGLSKD